MPRYQQIARQLKNAIGKGELKPGTRLPSSRTWAQELGVSRSTVENAYAELVAQGWLARRGQAVSNCNQKGRLHLLPSLPEKIPDRKLFRWDYPHSIFFRAKSGRG